MSIVCYPRFLAVPSFGRDKFLGNCGTPEELRDRQKQVATAQVLEQWGSACKQAFAERTKFVPIYRQIMEQRQQLKLFQATAQAHRKALVEQAQGID